MPSNAIDVRGIPAKFANRTDNVTRYLADIRNYPLLTPDEEIELINRYQQEGDMKARDRIILCNQRFVYAVARKYSDENNLLDLIDESNLALISALDNFKCDMGFKFISYAVWYLRANITLYLNNKSLVHRSGYLKVCTLLHRIQNQFFVENGRYPEMDEIRAIVAEKYENYIKEVENIHEVKALSLDGVIPETDDLTFADSVEFNKYAPSVNEYVNQEHHDYNRVCIIEALKHIPKREATVLSYLYGVGEFDKEHSLNEGALYFGLSSERVRQIRKKGLEHMQTSLKKVKKKEAV